MNEINAGNAAFHPHKLNKKQENIEKAAVNFEQYFIKKMLDNAQTSMPGDHMLGNNEQRKIMVGLKNQAISEQLAASKKFGIADLLIQQTKLNK